MEPDRAKELWAFLKDNGFHPYYFRSVYKQSSQPVAVMESICVNIQRSDRKNCFLVAAKSFEIVHGYPPPAQMKLKTDQTTWARPPETRAN